VDQNQLLSLLRRVCAHLASERREVPELEVLLDAFEAGGSLSLDLPTRALELGVSPRRLRRRLERLSVAGLSLLPAQGEDLAQVLLSSHGGASGGASGGTRARRDPRARPPVANGGTRAGGLGSVLRTGSCSFSSLRPGVGRVPLLAYTPEEEPAQLERARQVLDLVGAKIPSKDLPGVARAVYSASDYLGGDDVFDQVLEGALSKGPDLARDWEGWAAHIRKAPVEFLTRLSFVRDSGKTYRQSRPSSNAPQYREPDTRSVLEYDRVISYEREEWGKSKDLLVGLEERAGEEKVAKWLGPRADGKARIVAGAADSVVIRTDDPEGFREAIGLDVRLTAMEIGPAKLWLAGPEGTDRL